MAEIQASSVAGVVLAGGASSRMGRPKAFLPFLGQPLAARAIARLRPQVGALYLNARADAGDWAAFGVPLVFDPSERRGAGPLAGVAAALARATADGFSHLVTAPCDVPFLPGDLAARLAAAGNLAVAVSTFGVEPMFALWPVTALARVEATLAEWRASPRSVLIALGAAQVAFPSDDGGDPFANLNTPEEFAAAEAVGSRQ